MTAIDKAAQVIAHALSRHGEHGTYLDAARALDAAGLLATPAATGDARASWMGRDFPVTLLEEEQP